MSKKISGAELEIMEYLWEGDRAYTFSELLHYFNEVKEKKWSKQTFNTYLQRLKKRGFLLQERKKPGSLYRYALTRVKYEQLCAEEILQESYGGVLSNFIAALAGKNSVTELEKEELLKYIRDERE